MHRSILIAYATRYGSTQEVAEAVASEMRDAGVEVELRPLREVKSLEGYRAIVVGAALYMYKWHKDAIRFLEQRHNELIGRPVAIFALGPVNDVEKEWDEARGQLDKELERFPWLRPVEVKLFGGRFDPEMLKFPWNVVPGLKKLPTNDIRDWDAIRTWGRELAEGFRPPEV
jgi:menaquinone-dependent protoporphyrinogen oxidase